MRGGIWYDPDRDGDRERAVEMLKQIIKEYRLLLVEPVNMYARSSVIIFSNEDTWEVVSAKCGARGKCFNISYISSNINNEDDINTIKASTRCTPYTGYNYY